jgi:hypothetical protein
LFHAPLSIANMSGLVKSIKNENEEDDADNSPNNPNLDSMDTDLLREMILLLPANDVASLACASTKLKSGVGISAIN